MVSTEAKVEKMSEGTQTPANRWNSAVMNTYGTPPMHIARGKGCYVYDQDGKQYLDLLSGIAVNALGHAHPAIVEAVSTQIATLGHSSNLFSSNPVIQLAEALQQRFAQGDPQLAAQSRVFFCNSGTEANEAAFKMARLTGKSRILAAVHGFHGRTMGALAMTGQPDKRQPFAPLPGGVEFFPYGDSDYVHKLIASDPSNVAAIILEPIQGETGVIPAPPGFLSTVRELCDEHDILMILDEVQTGVGRTGTFYAHQHEGVLPDMVTMAKGLGGGLPIGAVVAHGKAASLFTPGKHGTTFGGNPVACAAGLAVLSVIDEEFCTDVAAKGEYFRQQLLQLEGVQQVRGRGFMLGVVLQEAVAKQVVSAGLDAGLILNAPNDHVLRLTPPLILSREHIDEAVQALGKILSQTNT